jgi:DDE family transposase
MDQPQYTTLAEVVQQLPDPRKRNGRRHRWLIVLRLIAAALACAQPTPQALTRWLNAQRLELLAALPQSVSRLPSASTIRRVLALVEVTRLEQALAALLPAAPPRPPLSPAAAVEPLVSAAAPAAWQGVALDGKALRGVGRDGHPCDLVSVVEPDSASVLAQVAVERKRDERSAVPELRTGGDLTNKLLSLDALHTLRPSARMIRSQGGHFLMIVKIRDVSFGEDAGHAAQAATAQVLATLRNGLLCLFRQAGWTCVPDGLAHYAASVVRAFTLIGLTSDLNVKT